MFALFEQISVLIIFAAIGFFLCRFKVADSNHSKLLSSLLVYVFLPFNIFKSFSSNFTVSYIKENYTLLLTSIAVLIVLCILAHFSVKLFSKRDYERVIYNYSFIIPNYGYMGYALAESIFGLSGLTNMILYGIPPTIYIYTVGFSMLRKKKINLKSIINPVIISMVLGMTVGLLNIELPNIITNIIKSCASCMAPTSMILTGMVISQYSFSELLKSEKTYIMTFLRLIIIPLLVGLILKPICPTYIVHIAVIFFAMPCGLNTIIFPKSIGEDCKIGASLAFVSTLLSTITIPLIFSIFGIGI